MRSTKYASAVGNRVASVQRVGSWALAAEPSGESVYAAIDTKAGADAFLDRLITSVEAAVSALTPEEQRYVHDELSFANELSTKSGGSYSSERVHAFYESKPFYEWAVHREMTGIRQTLDMLHSIRTSDARFALWAEIVVALSNHSEPMEMPSLACAVSAF
jgi:hypothetical protein